MPAACSNNALVSYASGGWATASGPAAPPSTRRDGRWVGVSWGWHALAPQSLCALTFSRCLCGAAGIYTPVVTSSAFEDHAVTLVGFQDIWVNATTSYPVWIIKNSWGSTWGVKGYVYMLRTPWGTAAPAGQYWSGIYSASYTTAL